MRKVSGDLVKFETNQHYTRVSSVLTNAEVGALSAISDPIGYPVRYNSGDWELIVAGDEADADGVIVEGDPIEALDAAATTAGLYAILARGPAVIDADQIASADSEAATFTVADIVAALEALNAPIICKSEPTKSSTQTS